MSSEAMSERELENAVNMATGILEKTAVSKHDTLGALSHALLQTHAEAAEANESLSLIYDHVTRGQITKPNTPVQEVMTLADDLERDFADQEVAERTKELETEAAEGYAELKLLRIQLRDESYLADELEASLKLLRERVGELEAELFERDALIARYENQEEEEENAE